MIVEGLENCFRSRPIAGAAEKTGSWVSAKRRFFSGVRAAGDAQGIFIGLFVGETAYESWFSARPGEAPYRQDGLGGGTERQRICRGAAEKTAPGS